MKTSTSVLHPRNKHKERYNFAQLIQAYPDLNKYAAKNKYGDTSIDFFNPQAVRALNTALLKLHYHIESWELPQQYLCPPIPGRVDYIHYLADVLAEENKGIIPKGKAIRCLDIGTGANCIYPLLGNAEYQWSFIGTDTDIVAIQAAQKVINNNNLTSVIQLKKQHKAIFKGVIQQQDRFDITLCNPPFHASAKEAQKANIRKNSNLKKKKVKQASFNFGGQQNELWCKGGEYSFVHQTITESNIFANNCLWFSCLISKKENLRHYIAALEKENIQAYKVIEMKQGQKISSVLCWTFLSDEKRKTWAHLRWQ